MNRETLKNQYLTYMQNHMSTAFDLSTWYEHTTGEPLAYADEHLLFNTVISDVEDMIPAVIVGRVD